MNHIMSNRIHTKYLPLNFRSPSPKGGKKKGKRGRPCNLEDKMWETAFTDVVQYLTSNSDDQIKVSDLTRMMELQMPGFYLKV